MSKDEIRKAIKEKRQMKNVTIAEVAKVVGKNPTFVAAALNGNHKFTLDEAKKVGAMLELDAETTAALSKFPVRTDFPNAIPSSTACWRLSGSMATRCGTRRTRCSATGS